MKKIKYTLAMFPIVVCSDIHGDFDALEKVFKIATSLKSSQILFAGDLGLGYSPDIAAFLKTRSIPFLTVLGNCDSIWDFAEAGLSKPPLFQVRQYNKIKVFITHGHRMTNPQNLSFSLEKGSIIITGHTHVAMLNLINGYYYLNPGSASRPRSREGASYALLYEDKIELCLLSNQKVFKSLTII